MSELLIGISAVSALAAAVAAWRSALASERGSAIAQRAALLDAIPILVPWVERQSTNLKVVNRGNSDAHEVRWRLIQGTDVEGHGVETTIIPKGSDRDLTGPQDGVLASLLASSGFVVRCDYITSWGEELSVRRSYENGKSTGIQLLSSEGTPLRIVA